MSARTAPRIIFITGTDTGVGKTLLTALLLAHLRNSRVHALAIKPFCSGNRSDAKLLHSLQDGELSIDEINPFFFSEPLAPLVAARKLCRKINLDDVLNHIRRIASSVPNPSIHGSADPSLTLLVEGAGGLLVPLGEDYSLLDLIQSLHSEVIVVARNKLGAINHTLLTVQALRNAGIGHSHFVQSPRAGVAKASRAARNSARPSSICSPLHSTLRSVVLMNAFSPHPSAISNSGVLSQMLAPLPLISIPFLGASPKNRTRILETSRRLKRRLTELLG